MIVRKLSYLNFITNTKKFSIYVYEGRPLAVAYTPEKGYAFFIDSDHPDEEMFLIETDITPEKLLEEGKDLPEYNQLVSIIESILNAIYKGVEIKEYERKHPEYVFMELMDGVKDSTETIDKDSDLATIIDNGFTKLQVDELNNIIKTLSNRTSDLRDDLDNSSMEEKLEKFSSVKTLSCF